MTNQAMDFDADYGARYKNLARQVYVGYDEFFLMILSYLSPALGPEANVLDVGCGPGDSLVIYGTHRTKWQLTGVDPSEQMIGLAKRNIEAQKLQDRVQLYQGYIDSLPQNEQYDAATLILVLHFLPDDGAKLSLLKSISERLQPGASFILTSLYGEAKAGRIEEFMPAWKNYMLDKGMTSEAIEALLKQAQAANYFVPEARIKELLAEAGFGQVELFYKVHMHGGWLAQKV